MLLRHPAVAEVSVVGAPDPDWGEDVVAFVVRGRRRCRGDGGARRALPRPHRALQAAQRYVFVDALPKNNYGKVLKTELRARLAREEGS